MRKTFAILILVFQMPTLPKATGAARTWVVISGHELDPRIKLQLQDLAATHQASLQFAGSRKEASSAPAQLRFELREENNFAAFSATLRTIAADAAKDLTPELAREGYVLTAACEREAGPKEINLTAADAAGIHLALWRARQLLEAPREDPARNLWPSPKFMTLTEFGGSLTLTVADFPAFAERGVVEGFYGVPWTQKDRLAVLSFEGRHGMNAYYYAPKDDPYHRKLWREPYPAAQIKRLAELAQTAQENFVDFCFALSPGLSITYSSQEDFETLAQKLESVSKLGISCFALFLDDVPQDLQDPQDRERFTTLAQAHTYLINKLYQHLRSRWADNRLTVTPTTYTNEWGSREYVRELGAGVDPHVVMVWTGPEVASPAITAAQAREWGELLRRRPLIWDNFPVNDGRPWRVHLGPLVGRDAGLFTVTRGLVSNPMTQVHASMLPLETVSDYLWDPTDYDPAKSHAHALRALYGEDGPRRLAPFLKAYGDYWWDENVFTPLFSERRYAIEIPRIEVQLAQLDSALAKLPRTGKYAALRKELAPLLRKTRRQLARLMADPAFRRLPHGKLQWREDYDLLYASRVPPDFKLDGDFSKWPRLRVHALNRSAQIKTGAEDWRGPAQFSARFALGWDDEYLYVGLDVTCRSLFQPFFARGIEEGDTVALTLETSFRKDYMLTQPNGNQYHLFLSPGNLADVKPSVFSDEDYLPRRSRLHDYNLEIKCAWRKTRRGYSGDIAIPVSFFDAGKFSRGYEIGLSLSVQKVLPRPRAAREGTPRRIVFTSKKDRLFPANVNNPATLGRLLLEQGKEL
jgi:hypothetical protein